MKINTALILCAGYGQRLNPLTLTEPKPLLKVNGITLLENCINLIQSLRIEKVIINTFYLKEKIEDFIKLKKTLIGINKLDKCIFLLNPLIQSPLILYPFSGIFCISILWLDPTNRISEEEKFLRNSSAIEIAGKICPPVPPPDNKNLFCFTQDI